jgi:hypothetical protein
MSDLLNSASLVMIPSGYKEDVVYSQIPTSGAGDLSFTRASNGTRVNSAGLVEVCPWNNLTYSEDFTNSIWQKINVSVTANSTTAPNGTTTASTLLAPLASGNAIYEVINNAETQTFSIYAKANTSNFIYLDIYDASPSVDYVAIFDLSNGTYVGNGGNSTVDSYSIESVGNGWYRISVSQNLGSASSSNNFAIGVAKTGNSTIPVANTSVYIWGAQLNIGSTAKPYFPTTDRLNVPRLTYQNGGGGCPSLLLEKQSTNLLIYSEQFDQWSTNSTTTVNAGISPDGTQNADRLNFTSGSVYWLDAAVSVTNGQNYTFSLYVKPTAIGNQFRFYLDGAFGDSTVITTDSSDWKRYTWTFTASATGSINPHVLLGYGYSSQSILAWGAQLEASTYPTSYIPTTSASATRVADACSKTGISSLIGQTSGVLFVDFIAKGSYDSNNLLMLISTGSGGDIIYLNLVGGTIEAYIAASSTQQFLYTSGTALTANTRHKLAIGYANNDIVLYHNGTQLATDTSATIPACSVLRVGDFLGGTLQFGNTINQSILFPTRLSNSELASLTSL